MHSLMVFLSRRLLAASFFIFVLGGPAVTRAAVLTSSDGKTREFSVVVSAARDGLTVREAPAGRDIVIPWTRLDGAQTAKANPWFEAARQKAIAGETVALNLGLPTATDPAPVAEVPAAPAAEWRTVQTTVAGGGGKNFTSLKLSAYVHREVAVPRLAVVWVGSPSPLAKRGDAADLARRMQGALVVADFEGGYFKAEDGSGEALISGVTALLQRARTGDRATKPANGGANAPSSIFKDKRDPDEKLNKESRDDAEAEAPAGETPRAAGPAIIVMGSEQAASFAWSLVCTRPADVLAVVTLNGVHAAESTAGAFATPCLFLESGAAVPAATPVAAADLTRPQALWRHYSTDGCRWCHAAPAGDPLALAVAFARDVAAASPYVEALEMLESWENNKLRHRIPMPVTTPKNFKEAAFRLATPDGASVFAVKARTGAARNDLVWVPSSAFAARLAGK